MNHVEQIKEQLAYPRRIAITMHQKPDGDAIGSSLGLYHFLVKLGHKVDVVAPTDYPDFLKWMAGTDKVIIGPEDKDRANWVFEGADIIFCLDFNALHRLAEFQGTVAESEATKIMIDHHMDPHDFADFMYIDDQASSTAELVYRLMTDLGEVDKLGLDMAECLYTGIMTDTGSFRFTNTSPAVHKLVAHLLEVGTNNNKIYDAIFNNSHQDRVRFTGYCISQCLYVLPEYRTAYMKVDREVFKQYNVKSGYTEGLVNYALSIKDIDLGVLITATEDLTKLSFRSRGEVSSAEYAQEFDGGGHFYAAGGKSKLPLEDVEIGRAHV